MEIIVSRIKEYKEKIKPKWDSCYQKNIWQTVHQAGSEEKNIELAKHETDLFLYPTQEKCLKLFNNKEINPNTTFYENFAEHKPIDEYLLDLKTVNALDFGCGSLARYSTEFAKLFKKVIAVDASPRAIEYCKKYTDQYENIEVVEVDGTSLKEIDDEAVSFVFSNLVFQHVGSKEVMVNLIKEVNRVLKPEGIFRASFWTEEKADDHFNVYHGTGYSVEGYTEVFEDAGFEVKTMTHNYPVLWVTLEKK